MGTLRPLFVLIFCVLACLGLVSLLNDFLKKAKVFQIPAHDDSLDYSLHETTGYSSPDVNKKLDIDISPDTSELSGSPPSTPFIFKVFTLIKSSLLDQEFSPNNTTVNKSSDKYFFFLFCLFVVVNLRVDIYFVVALIVLVWKLAKTSVVYLYVFVTGLSSYPVYAQVAREWLEARSAAVMPEPFVFMLKLFVKGDHRVNQWLQKSMDKIVSGLMIMFLLMFVIVGFVVLAMQVNFLFVFFSFKS